MAAPINSSNIENIRSAFIKAAIWHGGIDDAEAILAANPWLVGNDIHIAAILGDEVAVKKFILQDLESITATSAPYGGNALVYLCMSKYLSLKKRPESHFIKTATTLLDAGADPNSGFWETGQYPGFESALYGAAGVAQNAALTRLLLERGADSNDNESCYHSPETYDNGAMKEMVKTGKLTPDNLAMMLIRKHDWHDQEGAKYLLENGADPNLDWRPGFSPFHHAVARNNGLDMVKLLLDHNADPYVLKGDMSVVAHAARSGRRDVLQLLRQRNIPLNLKGVDELIAAIAEDNAELIRATIAHAPELADQVMEMGGTLLARFAGNGNAAGIKHLLGLGLDVNTPYAEGDGYFEIPKNSLPIHIAAWRMYPEVIKLLLERGTKPDQPDAKGNTPLMLAVKACTASYWMVRRSPDAVEMLLQAGADAGRVSYPCGYAEVDQLLKKALG